MRGCDNPLWPCAMAGAVSCLSGFGDLGVVIHGSSGCYFYPASILPRTVYGTQILEREVIFGSEERVKEVIRELEGRYALIALVTTCVPAVIGEDMQAMLREVNAVIVDAPGFLGSMETGYRIALEALKPRVDPGMEGVNIDGLNLMDPFFDGNLLEAKRLLISAVIPIATTFCAGSVEDVWRAGPLTLNLNPDLASGAGEETGSLLGLHETSGAFRRLERRFPDADVSSVLAEVERAEEKVAYACDKYLKRHDPPTAAIYGNFAYAVAVAQWLSEYLDATIAFIGSRNDPRESRFGVKRCPDLSMVKESLEGEKPDLILGSSYERSLAGEAAFVPITLPVRGQIRLRSRALIGPEGTLSLFEELLNALMNRKIGER
ncbi:MAG: nitrogenase component 1 [Methanomicrobiales archaeon]|nr:nitrogenase component 1 [Methanomicrobiales archaeon]